MKETFPNHYERAFQNWLIDHRIQYVALDRCKATEFAHSGIKVFDFMLHLPNGKKIIAEVKGRRFKGTTLAKLASLECWVTLDDVEGLTKWRESFGSDFQAVFVFVYKMDNVDVDFDGREAFDFDGNKYVFLCVKLDNYRRFMKRRSPKWKTVTLSADKFRQCIIPLSDYIS